jgi:hypothetical protein
MTADQWLSSTDPTPMLEFLRSTGRASERKLRLFGCACVRRIWHLLTKDDSRQGVETSEAFADGVVSREELERVTALAGRAAVGGPGYAGYAAHLAAAHADLGVRLAPARVASMVAYVWEWEVNDDGMRQAGPGLLKPSSARADAQRRAQCRFLLDIFGNPFRPLPPLSPSLLDWHGAAVQLAQAIYEERSLPSGHLDRARLSVLADMLEEAGCTDGDILNHCRGPGVHVRGCWAVDVILGKG